MFGNRIKKLPHDAFIKRLPSLVIGAQMLHPGNPYLLDLAIQKMPKEGVVLEIGSYGGLSTNLISYLLDKHGCNNKLFTCDPWVYEGFEDYLGTKSDRIDGRSDVLRTDFMNHLKNSFKEVTKLLSGHRLPHSFQLMSDELFGIWGSGTSVTDVFGFEVTPVGKISLALIDGDHAYAQAKKDYLNVRRHLLPGGLILFDDSGAGMPFGSAKLMKEVLKDPKARVVDKNPNYLIQFV